MHYYTIKIYSTYSYRKARHTVAADLRKAGIRVVVDNDRMAAVCDSELRRGFLHGYCAAANAVSKKLRIILTYEHAEA